MAIIRCHKTVPLGAPRRCAASSPAGRASWRASCPGALRRSGPPAQVHRQVGIPTSKKVLSNTLVSQELVENTSVELHPSHPVGRRRWGQSAQDVIYANKAMAQSVHAAQSFAGRTSPNPSSRASPIPSQQWMQQRRVSIGAEDLCAPTFR